MGTVSPGDVVRVVVHSGLSGFADDWQSVFHCRHDGSTDNTGAGLMLFLNDFVEDAFGELVEKLVDTWAVTYFEAYNLTKDEPIGEQELDNPVEGESIGESLPYQAQGLVTFPTLVKRVVGKKFIPGLTATEVSQGNTLEAGTIAALAAFAQVILDGISPAGQDYSFGAWSELYERFTQFTEALVKTGIFTQRRRKLGVGS